MEESGRRVSEQAAHRIGMIKPILVRYSSKPGVLRVGYLQRELRLQPGREQIRRSN
jgi:hypothetical protein